MDTKKVKLEYLYLDNETCVRCKHTEKQLDTALDQIGHFLQTIGYHFILDKIKMDTREKAVVHHFTKSPSIRVNGIDIGFEQRENGCSDCGDLCGCEDGTTCRTWIFEDQEYEVPPIPLLIDRILHVIFGNIKEQKQDVELPQNLHNYYSGIEKVQKNECCDSTCCG